MGIFDRFLGNKKKKEILPPYDMSIVKTDVHSHFIPGIDDGSQTIEDSLMMIQGLQKMGYKKVITTPHIMSDFYRNTPEIILDGLEKVRAALKENNIDMEIEAAAEYYLDFDLIEKIESKNVLTFGDNYFLFELPFISEPKILEQVIFAIKTNGYKPVLAHVERYNYWHGNFKVLERLKNELGVYFQLNISSLTGMYSPGVKKMAEECIDKEWFNFIGTDSHHMRHIEFTDSARTTEYLKKVIETNPLLNNTL